MKRQRTAPAFPFRERVERPQAGIDAERQRRALRAHRRVGEDAESLDVARNVIEQQRGAVGLRRRYLGHAADLEPRIGPLDAAQRAQRVDPLDETAQIVVAACRHRAAYGF